MCLQGVRCSYHCFNEYIEASNRYERATNVNEKIKLGEILEDKRKLYYATPRGQNWLRREADATTDMERENYLLLLKAGQALRESQIKAYQESKARKSTFIKEAFSQTETDLKMNKYSTATAIAYSFFLDRLPEQQFTILSNDTIGLHSYGKILVIPAKYQKDWATTTTNSDGQFIGANYKLNNILNQEKRLGKNTVTLQEDLSSWFQEQLELQQYKAVALINQITEDVYVLPLDQLKKFYEIDYRLVKRLGGTTKYFGDLEPIRRLLAGTVFEKGELIKIEAAKSTVLLNVPAQSEEQRALSSEFYLGLRSTSEEDYYEVRRRHVSHNYNFLIKLKALKNITTSGFAPELQAELAEQFGITSSQLS